MQYIYTVVLEIAYHVFLSVMTSILMTMSDNHYLWVILVGPVFGGRCGAEALGLGLGLPLGPAYRFALPPGLPAKTSRNLAFDQGRLPAIFIIIAIRTTFSNIRLSNP